MEQNQPNNKQPPIDRPVPEEYQQEIQDMFHSDSFEWMLRCLVERAQEDWANSLPDQKDLRKKLYYKIQALEALKEEIKRICTADAVEAHNRALIRRSNWSKGPETRRVDQ